MSPLRVLLVRHATGDHVGRVLAGRAPGWRLNAQGRAEAEALAERLRALEPHAVYSSPLERARETAEPLARLLDTRVREAPAMVELDYGDWTGWSLEEVRAHPDWAAYSSARAATRIPGGELATEVQRRAVDWLESLRAPHEGETVIVVSHGDVIRLALCHYLGLPIDELHQLTVDCASWSEVEFREGQAKASVTAVNRRA